MPRTHWCNSLRLRTYSPRALYFRSYVAPTFPTRWQRYCKIVGSRTATPARTSPWYMIRSACSTMFSGQPRSPSTCEHERAAARRWFGSLPAARVHSQRSLSASLCVHPLRLVAVYLYLTRSPQTAFESFITLYTHPIQSVTDVGASSCAAWHPVALLAPAQRATVATVSTRTAAGDRRDGIPS